ncbi:fumarylacetoacetate hydrolase domain-containing protein 2-like isoform X2 [Pectinophora gossypiella]|nr:fumarylacetoacetate hydrolase domain-containing protein 2-like isoform X2 [Pectinophora gossypiella]
MTFAKFTSCIIGPEDVLRLKTKVTSKVDWEVELCLVIGKTAQDVKAEDAYKYVLGFTVAQDISARDWQKKLNGGQFLLGKSMDTFCPIGPCITTIDEIGDPANLEISCSVNGVLKQKSNTNQLVHKMPALIERLSSVMTLLPGDIILTGTPGGVGMYRNPPEYLRPGDVIHSEIQKIGVLTTRVQEF